MTDDQAHVDELEGVRGIAETALWTAAARARENRRGDRLFADPLAALLAGDAGPTLLRHFHTEHAADDGNPFLPIRTRWFDDFLAAQLGRGIRQVVGLAAGLDTRAYRLDWPEDTILFELDQQSLLEYKAARLHGSGARPNCTQHVVAADLLGDWPAKLCDANFDPARPSVWFAEGVLFYLSEAEAGEVLRTALRLSAPGSRIAVDLIGRGIFRFPYMQPFLRKLADAGSPWRFGTDDPAGFVRSAGWCDVKVTEPGLPSADYGRWPAQATPNLPNLPRSFLVEARRPT